MKPNTGAKVIGPNSIPTKILKEFKTELSEPLIDMINAPFNKGIQVVDVISIHKKGEKLEIIKNSSLHYPISVNYIN